MLDRLITDVPIREIKSLDEWEWRRRIHNVGVAAGAWFGFIVFMTSQVTFPVMYFCYMKTQMWLGNDVPGSMRPWELSEKHWQQAYKDHPEWAQGSDGWATKKEE